MGKKEPAYSKSMKIKYGFLNHPNHKGIDRIINNLMAQGYTLRSRDERPNGGSGCFAVMFIPFWKRGWTDLTFIRNDMMQGQQPQYPPYQQR